MSAIEETITAKCGAELSAWSFSEERLISVDVSDGAESYSALLTVEMAEQHIQQVQRAIDRVRRTPNVVKRIPIAVGINRSFS